MMIDSEDDIVGMTSIGRSAIAMAIRSPDIKVPLIVLSGFIRFPPDTSNAFTLFRPRLSVFFSVGLEE